MPFQACLCIVQPQARSGKLGWQALTEKRNEAHKQTPGKSQPEFTFQSKAPAVDSSNNFPALPSDARRPAARRASPAQPRTPERQADQASSKRFSEVAKPGPRKVAPQLQQSSSITTSQGVSRLSAVHSWADAGLIQVSWPPQLYYLLSK